jgi:uncharacterized protein (TIGR02466 family)
MHDQTSPRLGALIPERPMADAFADSDDYDLALDSSAFEIRSLFPTPLIRAPLRQPRAFNDALERLILDRAAQEPSVSLSNAGGWQSGDDFTGWSGACGAQLIDLIRRLADSATGMQTADGFVGGGPAWKIHAWANVNRAGDANSLHHHPGAFWSGVYWVSMDESAGGGELEVSDPRGVMPTLYAPQLSFGLPGCLSAGGSDFITPSPGVMLLFPAWLQHAVRPHASRQPRISVAFNLCV